MPHPPDRGGPSDGTEPVYAIGDIHGQIGQLEQALRWIETDGGADARIVFLGDYVDRGPDSRAVLELLADGQATGRNWFPLLGNHDRMFAWFLQDEPRHDPHLHVGLHWLHDRIGGRETLASYGVRWAPETRLRDVHDRARHAIPQAHAAFLSALPTLWETEELVFVHAGLRPGVALAAQEEDDLIWIRREFLDHAEPHPKLVVHGHTAIAEATHHGNRVNLDTGAGYGRPLCAAVFQGGAAWRLTQTGRQPLAKG